MTSCSILSSHHIILYEINTFKHITHKTRDDYLIFKDIILISYKRIEWNQCQRNGIKCYFVSSKNNLDILT